MAEQSDSHTNEATQPKQTTRFQYPRGDTVIGEFFAANVYKSAALIDVIYLFHLDYGANADVSQILRERLMAARSDNSNGSNNTAPTLTPPATKRTVDMPDNTVADTVSDNADTTEETSTDTTTDTTVEISESTNAEDTVDTDSTADNTEQQSNTDKKSSDFNIAEMFD